MKLFSLDTLILLIAIIAAGLPVVSCLRDKRYPTKIEIISLILAFILPPLSYYTSDENSKHLNMLNSKIVSFESEAEINVKHINKLNSKIETYEAGAKANAIKLDKINSRIVSFAVEVTVDYSWRSGNNPLLDNGNDSGFGVEELYWLSTSRELIKLYTTSGYRVTRTGANSARFTARLAPKPGENPIGQPIQKFFSVKDFSTFVLLKGYWTNGRDKYPITIDKNEVVFFVNDLSARFQNINPKIIQPSRAGDTIFGLVDVHEQVERGIGSIFHQ